MSARIGDGRAGLDGISFCRDITQDTAQMKSSYMNPDSKIGNDAAFVAYAQCHVNYNNHPKYRTYAYSDNFM